jgi:hypothetical protein
MSNVGIDITQFEYYHNEGNMPHDENWGTYQYVLLKDIINNFLLTYVGDDKIINKVDRSEIIFHAKRGLQDLHYDALREIVGFEIEIPETLKVPLPHDFVSESRIAAVGENGLFYPIPRNFNSGTPISYLQDSTARKNILIDHLDNAITGTSVTEDNLRNKAENYPAANEFDIGKRFGLDTATSNSNGSYVINKDQGYIMFSSDLVDKNIVIEYVSDGMYGLAEDEIKVHKLAETYMYDHLNSCVLKSKVGVQEYVVRRAMKQASASLRNARIRMRSINLSELTQILRGRDKWIK